nr:hypothetical protein [uncultured bacterium]
MRSGGQNSKASRERATIESTDSTTSVRGLTHPSPISRSFSARPTISSSPARGVAYSSTNWSTFISRKQSTSG